MTARPALIKNIYAIPLPRPRDPLEIRFNEEFIELNRIIWEDLRDEVKLAGKQEHDQQNA